jgi:hypothetical protein
MTHQEGRDGEEETTRKDGMTERHNAAQRSPNAGMSGERAGAESESVDFDDMGDLDRGTDDATAAEPSTGPGPGYGMSGGPGRVTSRTSERSGAGNTGSDVRVADLGSPGESSGTMPTSGGVETGGIGVADDEGVGQGADMDPTSASGGRAPTGTSPRAGLGGTSSGKTTANDPTAGSGMANPADMGDQG